MNSGFSMPKEGAKRLARMEKWHVAALNFARARVSRIATVELSYCSLHDMAEKIAEIQFPPSPA